MLRSKTFFQTLFFSVLISITLILGSYPAFSSETYTITASADEHGNINPEGDVLVNAGKDISFTMIPDVGYVVENVLINGMSLGAVSRWTFTSVNTNHTIHVTFKRRIRQFVIKASAGEYGTIYPSGEISVNEGEDKMTFKMLPDAGYVVEDILIDGKSQGEKDYYTFPPILDNHTINVRFKKAPEQSENKVKISGLVLNDKTPLCAMVLANGHYMFSCDKNIGKYEMTVPLDKNGEITLFGFCDGMSPFKQILKPSSEVLKLRFSTDIKMSPAKPESRKMTLTAQISKEGVKKAGCVKVKGSATYNKEKNKATPLSIMVLANGQHMFTDAKDGKYELEVPLDKEGKITLFGFCDGFLPFKEILTP